MGKRSYYTITESHSFVILSFVKHDGDYLSSMKLAITGLLK